MYYTVAVIHHVTMFWFIGSIAIVDLRLMGIPLGVDRICDLLVCRNPDVCDRRWGLGAFAAFSHQAGVDRGFRSVCNRRAEIGCAIVGRFGTHHRRAALALFLDMHDCLGIGSPGTRRFGIDHRD